MGNFFCLKIKFKINGEYLWKVMSETEDNEENNNGCWLDDAKMDDAKKLDDAKMDDAKNLDDAKMDDAKNLDDAKNKRKKISLDLEDMDGVWCIWHTFITKYVQAIWSMPK